MRTFFWIPTYKPVGGVLKVFDYVNHALSLGHEAIIVSNEPVEDSPVFEIDRFIHLSPDHIEHRDSIRESLRSDDVVFFSWPTDYDRVLQYTESGFSHERIIHIVQNTRHANPTWINGYGTRLLARPMTRIMITDEVDEVCRPYLNPNSRTVTILEGHAWEYFHKVRKAPLGYPIRIGYTSWKSDIGSRVETFLEDDDRFVFRSIGTTVGWDELKTLYQWCDVFLACPNPEEGFYLPGLEAFAAGAILVTPDVGGNMAYCTFNENCLEVQFEDLADYSRALLDIAHDRVDILGLRSAAYSTLNSHTLESEKVQFGDLLDTLS